METSTTVQTIEDERRNQPTPRRGASLLTRFVSATGPVTGALIGTIVIAVLLSITQPVFTTWNNITNLIGANSVVLVLAIGLTFVLLLGDLDLSIVAASAASGVALGLMLEAGFSAWPAILLTLAVGLAFGAFNGSLISYARIPFLVTTLRTASLFASIALVLNDGQTINTFGFTGFQAINVFVSGQLFGVPVLLVFDALLIIAAAIVLRFTKFGRAIYAIGSNTEAARLNGINVRWTRFLVYVLVGLLAAVGAILQVGRLSGASPTFDDTLLLTVIAAVLIGGTSYSGGTGGVGGTVLGVLFLGVIENGLTLTEVSSFWRGTVNGLVLI